MPVESTTIVHDSKMVVKWSILVCMSEEISKHDHSRPKIDRNFISRPRMRGVTADWPSTLHGTSTSARACLMVGSAGCFQLG